MYSVSKVSFCLTPLEKGEDPKAAAPAALPYLKLHSLHTWQKPSQLRIFPQLLADNSYASFSCSQGLSGKVCISEHFHWGTGCQQAVTSASESAVAVFPIRIRTGPQQCDVWVIWDNRQVWKTNQNDLWKCDRSVKFRLMICSIEISLRFMFA